MNKIDFPLGVELPLRGGGTALLYEFFEDRWWGRATLPGDCWGSRTWRPGGGGEYMNAPDLEDIVWTPPKRKAWVIWGSDDSLTMISDQSAVAAGYATRGRNVQEVEES